MENIPRAITLLGSTRYEDPKIRDLQNKLQPKCWDDIINSGVFNVQYNSINKKDKECSLTDSELEIGFCMTMNTGHTILCNYTDIYDTLIENVMICTLEHGSHSAYSINPINHIGKFDVSCIEDIIEFINIGLYKLSIKNKSYKGE